jgi:putative ABC transport system permease protein
VFDLDKWEEIWLTMMQHKLRTGLTSFGVFWGIFMLVILLGAGKGLENGALRSFDVARNALFVWTGETTVPYAGFDAGRHIQLSNDDYAALSRLDEVAVIAPRLQVSNRFSDLTLTIARGDESIAFSIFADVPDFRAIQPYLLDEGRFLNQKDMDESRKVAVIGKRVRDELFESDERAVGDYIRIGDVKFRVIGVFDTRALGENAIQELQVVHVPLTTAQRTFNMPNRIDWFGILPAEGLSAIDAEESIRANLRKRHRISPDDTMALQSFNLEARFSEVQAVFTGISGFSWFVAIGTIIAGMVGVANIMMIIVKERTREIGIRKSVGAKPFSIISMIVLEALVISGVAGYAGLLGGVVIIEGVATIMEQFGMNSEFFADPEIDFGVAMSAIAVLVVSGTLAGLFPGMMAARVNPVLALRDE